MPIFLCQVVMVSKDLFCNKTTGTTTNNLNRKMFD